MRWILILLVLSGCSTSDVRKTSYLQLSRKELKTNRILVFGRFFNKTRSANHSEDHFVYTLDNKSEKYEPHFEGRKNFFWMLVPKNTKMIKLKTLTTKNHLYQSSKGVLAISQITPTNNVPVYLGEIVPTTEKSLINVEFLSNIREGQNYLIPKNISEGNFVLRKFERAEGLRDVLNRIQENTP